MDDEIAYICDGEGLALVGDPGAVEHFLSSQGIAEDAVDMPPLRHVLAAGGTTANLGAELAENSGRWVKLTKESAHRVQQLGLRKNATSGVSTGVLKGKKGQIKGFVEFATGPGAALSNPAVLAGVGGIMAQVAMQQAMDDITDYLATIDEKVDDVLRAQKDAALARLIGVGLMLDEAMALRAVTGRVDDITWSKVQGTPQTIAETQAYALRQLDALAEKIEAKSRMGALADAVTKSRSSVREWIAVLARCFELQEAIGVLELDRVMDSSPDDVNAHRVGLQDARQRRRDAIARSTGDMCARMEQAAETANANVLLHPRRAPEVVAGANESGVVISTFHALIGIDDGHTGLDSRRWTSAAVDARDQVLRTGGEGVDAAKRLGGTAVDRTRSGAGQVARGMAARAERIRRRPAEKEKTEAADR